MTHYQSQLERLRETIYANRAQMAMALRARHYLHAHYAEDLDLRKLADAHRVSPFHLLRLFKRYFGRTPGQYLSDWRVRKARELLTGGMGVTETCHAVGFRSPGSFCALFKRKTGVSPTRYRNAQFSRSPGARPPGTWPWQT